MTILWFVQTLSKGITVKPWLKLIGGEAPVFAKLEIFRLSHQMAVHAGRKQAVAAQNVANADTPNYAAKALPDFQETIRSESVASLQRATRSAHINGVHDGVSQAAMTEPRAQKAPNGNSVSVETEIMNSVDAKRQHDRALAIYKSGLNILRGVLKG